MAENTPSSRPATPLSSEPNDLSSREGDHSDSDSAFVDSASRHTESVASSAYAYRFANGRRYHAYDGEAYQFPNDESEQDRLDLQHHIFRLCADNRLYLAPIPADLHSVLDVGTGTGIWAIEFADEHPSATVVGIDLSPIQPNNVPVNCSFRVDNLELDWIPEEKYDFIHSRAMVGAIKDWPRFLAQSFDHLKPGGYIELQDLTSPVCCNDPTESSNSIMVKYGNHVLDAGRRIGLDFQAPYKWREMLQEAGFVDINIRWFNWPIGPWAKGVKNKMIGRYLYVDFHEGLEVARLLFTNVLGWSSNDFDNLIAQVRAEMEEQKIHLYERVCFCYARKPGGAPAETPNDDYQTQV
ncbi:uncharacterized protein PV09_04110 [Verruconis gallopava]|uniref:Methyltransferase domain-containing protein n=1 Tax=Verruconis gallopava TaxID=253628 RepID=A0A0D2AET0_9PEZI|nr:uncharacterized protein PV09_04110 [Verruconis gallopava]KIW04945.1 hypothetical protein PV09_04110 [Verruconis gallopava]